MPSPSAILDGLTAISNHWRGVAVAWHVLVGMLVISLVSGWRPTERLLAVLITLPLLSVSVLAWSAGNAFNGVMFAGLAFLLFGRVPPPSTTARPLRLSMGRLSPARRWWRSGGCIRTS